MPIKFFDSKSYSDKTIESLQEKGFDVSFGKQAVRNTHDVTAAHRAALEAQACNGKRSIWDIGGHRKRHDLNHRRVHCTQPNLTSHDVLAGSCSHTALTCDCPGDDTDCILMVHSAYYMTEDEMFRVCAIASQLGASFYSVEHQFTLDTPVGRCDDADYAMFYDRAGRLSIKFTADQTYQHTLPPWFLRTNVLAERDGLYLIRSYVNRLGGTYLVSYHTTPVNSFPDPIPLMRHYSDKWVNVIPFLFSIRTRVPSLYTVSDVAGGVQADFRQTDSMSAFIEAFPFGDYFKRWLPYTPSQIFPVYVPERLITYLSNLNGTNVPTETLRVAATQFMRSNSHLFPLGVSPQLVKEAAIREVQSRDQFIIEGLSAQTALHAPHFSLIRPAYAAMSLLNFIYLSQVQKPEGSIFHTMFKSLIPLPAFFAAFWKIFKSNPFLFSLFSMLTSLAIYKANSIIKRRSQPISQHVPAVESNADIPQLVNDAIPGSVHELCTSNKTTRPVYVQLHPSWDDLKVQVFSTSVTNTNAAIIGRFLKKKPNYNEAFWETVKEHWAKQLVDPSLTGIYEEIFDIPTQSILEFIASRKLPKQRANYERARLRLLDMVNSRLTNEYNAAKRIVPNKRTAAQIATINNFKPATDFDITVNDLKRIKGWHQKTAFPKKEKTFVVDKLPRVIIASQDTFQVVCGPHISRLDHALVELLPNLPNSPVIHYTVGWNQHKLSQQISDAFHRAAVFDVGRDNSGEVDFDEFPKEAWLAATTMFVLGDDNLTIFPSVDGPRCFTNDFSSFDTTHSEHSWYLQRIFMTACGVPQPIINLLEETTADIDVRTQQYGGKFEAHYNMCSGNPNTCNGNSIINAAVTGFLIFEFSNELFNRDISHITAGYHALGFEPKCKVTTIEEADYLSGIILPVSHRMIWIPKVFRLVTKSNFVACPNPFFQPDDYMHAFIECYQHYSHIPVLRTQLEVFRKLVKTQKKPRIKSIIDNDRNLWYGPQASCYSDVTHDDITEAFCLHYSLTYRDLQLLEEAMIFHANNPDDRPWSVPSYTECFLMDVPDYSPDLTPHSHLLGGSQSN